MQQRDANSVPQAGFPGFSSAWQLPVHAALNAQISTLLIKCLFLVYAACFRMAIDRIRFCAVYDNSCHPFPMKNWWPACAFAQFTITQNMLFVNTGIDPTGKFKFHGRKNQNRFLPSISYYPNQYPSLLNTGKIYLSPNDMYNNYI